MATPKKNNPNAQAPRLITQIQTELFWTQKDLERYLGMKQQSVSNYLAGRVMREQHDVIRKLENILAKKLPPPTVTEVITDELPNGKTSRRNVTGRKKGAKKAGSGPVQARRTKGNF